MQQAKFKKMAAIAAASVLGGFGIAQGSLTLNLVQDGTNATSVSATPGQTITLDVIGTVTGTNGSADEGLQSVDGGILSSKAGFVTFNDQTSATPSFVAQSPFTSTVQQGVNQSFNGGDMLGTTQGGTSTNAVQARSGGMTIGATADSASFLLAKVTFTVAAGATGSTTVSFVPYTSSTGAGSKLGGTWQQDNGAPLTGATGTELSGTAVTISAPEPGSIALLGLGGLGLLLRRRSAM
jgi:hypothetical protein